MHAPGTPAAPKSCIIADMIDGRCMHRHVTSLTVPQAQPETHFPQQVER